MRSKRMSKWLATALAAAVTITSIPAMDVAAAETEAPLLLNLDFNSEAVDNVFTTDTAKATATGGYELQEKAIVNEKLDSALYLNGTNAWLDVKAADGSSLLSGKEEITVSYDAKVTKAEKSWSFYAAPNANAPSYQKEHYMAAIHNSGNMTVQRYNNSGSRPGNDINYNVSSEWMHVDIIMDETTTKLYVNGEKVGNHTSAYKLSDILGTTGVLQIGKANWESGEYFGGLIDNYKIYDGLLSEDEIAAQYAEFEATLDAIANSEETIKEYVKNSLGTAIDAMNETLEETDKSVYTKNSWDAVLAEISAAEEVYENADATKDEVKAAISAMSNAYENLKNVDAQMAESLAELEIASADDIRSDIGLIKETRAGDSVDWESSNPAVITDEDTDEASIYGGGIVTRPEAGAEPAEVTLTATVTVTAADDSTITEEKAFTVTVSPMTANIDTDYTAGYFWPHFGTEGGYEKIFYGYSEDGLTWNKLNKVDGVAKPILANDAEGSDLGVRDPHLIRSADGDKYWLLGTDLHAEGGGAGGSGWNTASASQNIVVWESNDLVNWSEPYIVYAGFDTAGCVWAPEAYYDKVNGDYVVYWSIRDQKTIDTEDNAIRVYVCRTRDFHTFTESKVWLSEDPATSGVEYNIIDSSIVEEDGKFYRFSTSDWNTIIDVSDTLDTEDVLDVRVSEEESKPNGSWKRLVTRSGCTAAGFTRSEGYTVFQLPDGKWCAMGDNGGYIAFTTDSLASGKFTSAKVSFPDGRFRHGSVIRLSETEEAAILEAFADKVSEGRDEEEAEGPVLEYNFDEDEGLNIMTDSGLEDESADNGALYGNAEVVYDEERESYVLQLDGTTGAYGAFPQGFFDGRNTMTISMDVKSNMDSGNFFTFAYGKDSTYYNFMRVRGTAVRDALTTTSWENEAEVTGTGVAAGKWQKVVIVIDGTTMKLYLDGGLVDTNDNTGITTSALGTDLLGYLGKSFYSDDKYFNGSFDNIQIYNRVLSDEEIVDAVIDKVNLVKNVVIGTVPSDPANTMGTDNHTAVTSDINKESKTITSYVRKGTDRSAVPVELDLITDDVTVTVNGVPFTNGSTLDLRNDATLVAALAGRTETYTIKKPQIAANPVLPGQYADPDIDYFDGKYWIYPTTDGVSGWGGTVFHAWSSEDMYNWTDEGIILDVANKEPGMNENGIEIAASPWSNGNAWAPTIQEIDGKYYFAYCGQVNSDYEAACVTGAGIGNKAIGIAVADSPEGPFVAQDMPLLYPTLVKNSGCGYGGQIIDPSFFTDDDGTTYILFGNGNAGIAELDLSGDEVAIVDGSIRKIQGMTEHRESPYVVKRDGIYHFTWSCDDTGSPNYHVKYGVIEGFDTLADALAEETTTLTVNYKYPLLQKVETGEMLGTAHQSVLYQEDTDKCYISYHRFYTPLGIYTSGLGYHRETCIDEITFDEDGYMKPLVPTMEGVSAQRIANEDKAEADKVIADIVIAKIKEIGTVTAQSKAAIDAAKAAYEKLTPEQKALVTNAAVLTQAEKAYQAIVGGSNTNNGNTTTPGAGNGSTTAPGAGSGNTTAPETGIDTPAVVPTPELILADNPAIPTGKSDEAKGAKYGVLKAQVKKTTKSSNKVQWSKVKAADGYVVLGNICNSGKKKYAYEVLTIIDKNTTTSFTHKKLKKDTYYKYIVQAYKMVDGKVSIIETSKTIHSATKASKYANVKSLKVNKKKVTLAKKGKSFKLKVTQKKTGKKLVKHRAVSYESSNTKVATVNSKGKITAKKKGTCTIYVYAQNGICQEVKVTVKK